MVKMRTFSYKKLCRDAVHIRQEKEGSLFMWYRLDDKAYDEQLRAKLQEEAIEVVESLSTKELLEELADVQEVVDALCSLHGITKDALLVEQDRKREARGGFAGRIFIEKAMHPVGSRLEQYCSSLPAKYPEIIDV